MALELSKEQLSQIKQQLSATREQSHLVIFKTTDPQGGFMHMITDYNTFENLKQARSNMQMEVVRDIIPITDSLAYWAVAQDTAGHMDPKDPNMQKVALDIEEYTNEVLKENKLPENKLSEDE
ncbi:hypothetical protein MOO46_05910 [Apilactobacillus apisilvae]|uniref:Phage protein n=1 Tax=Apilactobacillus apisilvae TaxID=2923364 RepID=A0ABY4PGC3_9LACO|nr:hypothetical protein [Apilactobacillus apisilvae]UQS84779.1 hypothetical protein MOO46_05910 [Apilactobacillus apisilvae]